MRSTNLVNKLLQSILPLVWLFLFAVGLGSYFLSGGQIRAGVHNDVHALAAQAAASLESFFHQGGDDLEALTQVPLFSDYFKNVHYGLQEEAESYRREIERYLQRFAERSKNYTRLEFLGSSGKALVVVAQGKPIVPVPGAAPVFFDRLRRGERYVSPLYPSVQTDVLIYAAPIMDETGEFQGAVVMECSLRPLLETLARVRVGAGGEAYLADRSGRAVLGGPATEDHSLLQADAAIHGTHWKVVVLADPADYLAPLKKIQLLLLVLASGAGVLVALLVARQIRRVTKPLENMAKGTRQLAMGNLDYIFEEPDTSELQSLAQAFNEMTRSLKERNSQLENRIRELTSLREMEGAVIERRDEETVLRLCLHAAARGLGFDRTALYWVDKAKGEIVGRYTYGSEAAGLSEESFRTRRVTLGAADILNDVVQRRVAALVRDTSGDPRLDQNYISESKTPEFVMAPICGKDRVFGVLTADNAYTKRPLEETDREGLMLFANATGLALENAMLVRDISESEARYRTVLENSPVAVIGLSSEHWITIWNRGAEQIFGYAASDVIGKPLTALFPPDAEGEHRGLLAEMLEKGSVRDFPVSGRTKAGKRLALSLSWGGAFPGFWMNKEWTVVIRDVTEARKLQEQLARSEKLSAAGQLIASIAHELNNPLTAVIGFSSLAADKPVEPELLADLREIHTNAMRCKKIIANLLLFVRQGEVRKEPLRAEEVVRAAASLLEFKFKNNTVALQFEFPRALPRLQGDFQQIEQVAVNLINNACDAMALQTQAKTLVLRGRHVGDRVRLEFIDNGPGVPEEARHRLFEPLFTTKPEGHGTGLGLTVCQQIVESHGGTIGYQPADTGGAMFWFEIPISLTRPSRERAKAPQAPAVPGKTVLAVDDEPAVLGLLVRLLKAEGHSVSTASSLAEAWDKASDEEWDLIVSDVRLQDHNGLDLHREWDKRVRRPRPAFVFITGDVMNEALQQEFERLKIPLLYKPVEVPDFHQCVRSLLARRAASG